MLRAFLIGKTSVLYETTIGAYFDAGPHTYSRTNGTRATCHALPRNSMQQRVLPLTDSPRGFPEKGKNCFSGLRMQWLPGYGFSQPTTESPPST